MRKLEFKHKKNKPWYYAKAVSRELIPQVIIRFDKTRQLAKAASLDDEVLRSRVNYYNQIEPCDLPNESSIRLADLKIPQRSRAYYFDTYEYTRYFDQQLRAAFLFGDITHVPEVPSIVKSRPIFGNNRNSVLLNLDKARHFNFINDPTAFRKKRNMLVGRAMVHQAHRIRFYEMYFHHPLCNLGQINNDINTQWYTPRMTIREHLRYKFILCIEGNDVATNLKWVMSSNSIAVMPRPRYETWFREGTLRPNVHFIEIRDDYSDLEEKLDYYIQHPEEAEAIIENAHAYINTFRNKVEEDVVSLLVLEKYFHQTGQIDSKYHPYFS